MTSTSKLTDKKIYFISWISALFIGVSFLLVKGISPFGDRSFAIIDGDIQYLDFFAFYKQVLCGNESLSYSINNQLGFTSIGLFSYYLASPINLLLIFIPQSEIISFFNIAVILKVSLSSLFMSVFIRKRFPGINSIYNILFPLAYGFMQYNMAQASNIMWLDGVYMLPLMMTASYLLIEEKRKYLLSIFVGISILLNWYTGGINCIFLFIYFICELIISCKAKDKVLNAILSFIINMFLGLTSSFILFLPTVYNLLTGKGNSLDITGRGDFISGNILTVIRNYIVGGTSSLGSVCLYSGTFVIVLALSFFFNKKSSIRERIVLGIFTILMILIYYIRPLITLFSLFKNADSYFYRYSYVSIAFLIYVAANNLKNIQSKCLIIVGMVWAFAFVVTSLFIPAYFMYKVITTLFFIIVVTLLIAINFKHEKLKNILVSIVVISELIVSTNFSINMNTKQNVNEYKEYVKNKNAILQEIDTETGRINQIMGRTGNFSLNEAMAYNYKSIQGYSSFVDNRQLNLLNQMGYYIEWNFATMVNTSITPVDSLLGVKYIINYDGELLIEENQYAFPLAFTYDNNNGDVKYEGNPFEYVNELYEKLTGCEKPVFIKANYSKEETESEIKYSIEIPDGNYQLYGNLPWNERTIEEISFEDGTSISYADWGSLNVFPIPYKGNTTNIRVNSEYMISVAQEQFYICDLDVLREAAKLVNGRKVNSFDTVNNSINCKINSEKEQNVFMSVAYIDGMTLYVNGIKTVPELVGDCLISVPISEGNNEIEIKYAIPGFKVGCIVSAISIAAIIFLNRKKRDNKV